MRMLREALIQQLYSPLMSASFRPAALSDLETLIDLVRAFYEEDGTPFDAAAARTALRGLFADAESGVAFLIENGAEALGYLVVTFGYSLEFLGRDAFVDELYVRPQARGQGLGREALRIAEQACREHGVRALHLEVRRGNAPAQGLYHAAGFEDREHYLMTKRIR